jgi:hypothetical protein
MEVQHTSFLVAALVGGRGVECSASCPDRFTLGEDVPGTFWKGDRWAVELVWTRWKKISCLCRESKEGFSLSQPCA